MLLVDFTSMVAQLHIRPALGSRPSDGVGARLQLIPLEAVHLLPGALVAHYSRWLLWLCALSV